MTQLVRVVIAIPTLNETATIESVLRTLTPADMPNLRIVVVDGGSSDDTCAIVRGLAAELPFIQLADYPVFGPALGIAAAINLVARTADADILIRCDAHAIYPRDYVPRLLETLRRTGATSVVVPMDSVGRGCFQKAVAWVCDMPIGSGGAAHRGGHNSDFVDHGHHAAFRLDTFLAVGGYDESFSHNEDAELDCRLRAAGGVIYLDADIRIGYYPRATPRALWRQYFRYGRGRSRTMRRYPGSIRFRQLAVPGHVVLSLASIVAAAIAGRWSFLAWPMLYLMLLAGTSLLLAARQRIWCGLWSGPAAFIMHTAWAGGFFAGLLFIRETHHRRDLSPMRATQ
jgi:succinoglycan biosynthesis protein ExoA